MATPRPYTTLETARLEREGAALPGDKDTLLGLRVPVDHEWREVRRYAPTSSDGHEAIVSVRRLPAMFWRVQCPDLDIDLDTGSDMHELIDSIARAIADGMLSQTSRP